VAGITAQSLNTLSARLAEVSDPAMARPEVLAHWDAYFEATVREAQAGAKLVIWPEVSAAAPPQWGAEPAPLIARAQEVARQNGIYLAVPLYVGASDAAWSYENKLLLIDPTGAIVMEHVKFGGSISEAGRRIGDRKLRTVATPFGVLSGAICYDADYPVVIKQTAGNGTGLLIVPSKDWLEIDPVHTHMAVFRAIENGTSLWRQTDTGLSIAVDPYGRVLAQTDFFTATDPTMVAQVPVKHVATLYGSFGGWFEWLCVAGFLLVMARALTTRPVTKV
jgi:apolipoprotein N-acyltransferase